MSSGPPAQASEPARPADPPYRPGSREDFDRLYRTSHPKILATLVGVLGDRAAAEDCAQEAFVQALRAWPRWKPEAPAEAWLHRIALNLAISVRRRQRVLYLGDLLHLVRSEPRSDPDAIGGDGLFPALRRLPAKQAAAVVLRHFHGYSNREIAAALGIPERTVASRLASARERLRVELGLLDGGRVGSLRGARAEMGTPPPPRVLPENA
jgi:RNA polymerase sigma-70 factor (ECF subfamily)